MESTEILILEDDDGFRNNIKDQLLRYSFKVFELSFKVDIFRYLRRKTPHLIILGSSPGYVSNDLKLVREIRKFDRRLPIIMITDNNSQGHIIDAFRMGVNDYLKQRLEKDELIKSIRRCLSKSDRNRSQPYTQVDTQQLSKAPTMIGKGRVMQEIKTFIRRVAATESNVLITGETGTGKELVADLIYRNSARAERPFVSINSTAIPDNLLESELFGHERGSFTGADTLKEGRLRQADGGTVFFDEIGDMGLFHQAKILRVIENKEIQRIGGMSTIPLNIRIIAATNQDLEKMVLEGTFRKDLYYRLNVASIHLPPLRERKEDIPEILDFYIRDLNSRSGKKIEELSEDTLKYLLSYDWPGNIREIKNILESTFINLLTNRITLNDLPAPFQRRIIDAKKLTISEKDRLLSALLTTNWNKSQAAKKLNWSRMTLYRKITKYRLDRSIENEPPAKQVTLC
ncbi:MAG: sigma-54-dependent Fis family transcriptional regulator [Candidatus Scalindua sp. AMX11]|nr:MAG: sigma-54-dependent Fis family transcriptional regulator [Candidatus Scalindua sp.]NOG82785.1 sigma-54-dependent Fis family transcriptional regulator [Planctomycetota bacterium]RZV69014.1 MAG: sigma-54-dependent Fis family transcriptional regulator [Candidatus Scalindua sp. SCAELEC01]TDE63845.1 MAG: sigma-54-dependent Fis family transcriptional regulator [Candidatus Scalindua sp. AMX11]GJQ60444.1 MAG: acetoacetate metabolism regulatory protein AtoC [Candidatus Scalindua sp.]